MMEDYWFLPDVGGQPLQKFFECHMEEAKRCAQQPSKRPQKTDTTPQIFQKKLQRIVYFYLCYGQASCWEVYNASFHIFLVGLRYCKLTLLHYCAGDLGRHGNASCYRDYSTHCKTIIKKANGFQVCCLQVSSKKI